MKTYPQELTSAEPSPTCPLNHMKSLSDQTDSIPLPISMVSGLVKVHSDSSKGSTAGSCVAAKPALLY